MKTLVRMTLMVGIVLLLAAAIELLMGRKWGKWGLTTLNYE